MAYSFYLNAAFNGAFVFERLFPCNIRYDCLANGDISSNLLLIYE